MIIETCPRCGAPLLDSVVATFPPIPQKDCPSCGWHWEGKPEPVKWVPFKEETDLNINCCRKGDPEWTKKQS